MVYHFSLTCNGRLKSPSPNQSAEPTKEGAGWALLRCMLRRAVEEAVWLLAILPTASITKSFSIDQKVVKDGLVGRELQGCDQGSSVSDALFGSTNTKINACVRSGYDSHYLSHAAFPFWAVINCRNLFDKLSCTQIKFQLTCVPTWISLLALGLLILYKRHL